MKHPYFIAEIGQNHNGDVHKAVNLVEKLAKIPGVSAIKTAKRHVDKHRAEWEATPYSGPQSFGANYYEHRKALELTDTQFMALKSYTEHKGLDFISSFTDAESLDFLLKIGVNKLKVASSRVKDLDLLEQIPRETTVYLSTGMSSMEDIQEALIAIKARRLILMQCTSAYPCPEDKLNLKALDVFRLHFRGRYEALGFSGHHLGIAPDIAAYTLGATVIERHVTTSRALKGTDHAASLELAGVEKLTRYLKQAAEALGSPIKTIQDIERPAMEKLRHDLK